MMMTMMKIKNAKRKERSVIKQKLKFEDDNHFLKAP